MSEPTTSEPTTDSAAEVAHMRSNAIELGATLPLLQAFCCCIPISALAPGLSRRTRLLITGAWLLVTVLAWALSIIPGG